ncbi:hypothetical protein SAMN05216480_103116 [Pustulibacterium marinum]|uniref:Uncharacterized protein n=1 Tax=Pustulibacterium marinum TaxID=1224947 RepID=A0A1I7G347_9FLAO|nr:hypothetical protein [Pustulibacterium marinum]SFU42859.1 hypothetical protein SAMN05216480_103116 [Pustulibacterium marinum]
MNRIRFYHLHSIGNIVFSFTVFLCIIIALLYFFNVISNPYVSYLIPFGYFGITVQATRAFWFKHYIQWNAVRCTIKLNGYFARQKTIRYRDYSTFQLAEDKLHFIRKDGGLVSFSLKDITQEDKERLQNFFQYFMQPDVKKASL